MRGPTRLELRFAHRLHGDGSSQPIIDKVVPHVAELAGRIGTGQQMLQDEASVCR